MKQFLLGNGDMGNFLDNIVRIGALVSLVGLLSGYRAEDTSLKIMEILMLIIWAQMDYKKIISIIRKNKD